MINNSKTLNIFGTTYTIEYVDKINSEDPNTFVEGLCESALCNIKLATKLKDGSDMPKNMIEKNLYHELIHAILAEGGYLRISEDEPLVEWLARCLYSVQKQGVL